MKRISTILLALIATTSLWAADFIVNGIAYNIINAQKHQVEVTSNDPKYTGAISIPSSIYYNDMSYSVSRIGSQAFAACTSLTSITIPNSVLRIEYAAFRSCSSITSITILNSDTYIGPSAFANCSSLTSFTIPNGVTNISDRVFLFCKSLTSITLPDRVKSIGTLAFSGCSSLTTITIPNSVTKIGFEAFFRCDALTSVNVDAANTHYASIDGVLYNYAKDTLIQYPTGKKMTSFAIPNSVTRIGHYAFSGCSSLTSITIPNSVTSIDDSAFSNCSSKLIFYVPANSLTKFQSMPAFAKFNVVAIDE